MRTHAHYDLQSKYIIHKNMILPGVYLMLFMEILFVLKRTSSFMNLIGLASERTAQCL